MLFGGFILSWCIQDHSTYRLPATAGLAERWVPSKCLENPSLLCPRQGNPASTGLGASVASLTCVGLEGKVNVILAVDV